MQKKIKVAIAGVGNCASALVQGVEYYRSRRNAALDGVMHQVIGGYRASDVEFVSAFDVDKRKVGRPLEEAIFAKPNNTRVFQSSLPVSNVVVQMGPELDGVAPHMADYDDDVAFRSGGSRADQYRRGSAQVWRGGAVVLPAGRLRKGREALCGSLPGGGRRDGELRARLPRLRS